MCRARSRPRASPTRCEAVRLDPALLRRYPHQLSGGEAQRVSIALAVALRAELILADEATSALDVTVQAEVAELFRELRVNEGTAFLLVSHDLALVAGLADRIAIIAEGRIVETGGPEVLRHPAACRDAGAGGGQPDAAGHRGSRP